MYYFKIIYANGITRIVKAQNCLEVVKRYDLASKENLGTQVLEVSGDDAVII